MQKYQNAKIYKIISDATDKVYIGSTTEPTLARRLAQHRNDYNMYLRGKKNYIYSFKILETGSYSIVLVENFSCESRDQLRARERHYIETTPNCVNKNIPNRTAKEYYKLYQKDYMKGYYLKHKQQFKERYKANQDDNKKQQKKYRESNSAILRIKKRYRYLLKKVNNTIKRGEELVSKIIINLN